MASEQSNKLCDTPNKRSADNMDNHDDSENANKAMKTKHQQQNVIVDAETSLSLLKVKDLNTIMWCNFQQMHAQSMVSVMANLKTVVREAVQSELTRLEGEIKSIKQELVTKKDLGDLKGQCEIKQLETDIELSSLKCSLDSKAEKNDVDNLVKRMEAAENTNKQLTEALQKQQNYLETIDADKRANNLIITGVVENEESDKEGPLQQGNESAKSDEEKIKLIMETIGAGAVEIISVQRLGERLDGPNHRPRPIKVVLKEKRERKTVLDKAKDLKSAGPTMSTVYINKDMHPAVRKERGRIRQVLKREKANPDNHGRNIVFDKDSKCVMVDDVAVDKYQPSFL